MSAKSGQWFADPAHVARFEGVEQVFELKDATLKLASGDITIADARILDVFLRPLRQPREILEAIARYKYLVGEVQRCSVTSQGKAAANPWRPLVVQPSKVYPGVERFLQAKDATLDDEVMRCLCGVLQHWRPASSGVRCRWLLCLQALQLAHHAAAQGLDPAALRALSRAESARNFRRWWGKARPVVDRIELQATNESEPVETLDSRHSVDFREVTWYGEQYHFTSKQAMCVAEWWYAMENGTSDREDGQVQQEAGVDSPFRKLFRKHPAWKTMIVEGSTKGTHRLNIPSD